MLIEIITDINDSRLDEMYKIETEFFNIKEGDGQLQGNNIVTNHIFNIGGCCTIVNDNDIFIGFGTVLPTIQKLMYDFLNDNISENELGMNSIKCKYDAIYFVTVYIKPEYRNLFLAKNIIYKAIDYLYKDDVTIFYDPISKEGDVIGRYLSKKYINVISKKEWNKNK